MKSLIVLVLALIAPAICVAENVLVDDLTNCRWRDGSKISQEACDDLKGKIKGVTKRLQQLQEWPIEYDAEEWAIKLTEKRIAELDEYTKELLEISFKTRNGRSDLGADLKSKQLHRDSLLLPKDPENKTPQQIEIDRIVAEKKRAGGNDYKRLYIGMKLGKLITCYGAYFEAKIADPGGIIAIYQTMYEWVQIQNGIVINYTRRRD